MINELESLFLEERERIGKELTIIKTLPLKKALNQKEKSILLKFSFPNIYSIWEGYVKFIFRAYINELNTLSLESSQIHNNLLTHSIECEFAQFRTGFNGKFEDRCSFFIKLFEFLKKPISINSKLPTESNINLKVLNKILFAFNLEKFPESPFRGYLDYLLEMRNRIAHGEGNEIPIDRGKVDECINNISNLMDELMQKILKGYKEQTYKNSQSSIIA